jgi:hypothetical protein
MEAENGREALEAITARGEALGCGTDDCWGSPAGS